uniref:RNA-directed RNA polymerase n=1 Tax=Amasya cherry disease-associated mycovirus TaxID=284689 RepID=Q1HA37_9VIRU|nr:RNA-dependent RNA polymerase 2 [Amasya cherry disease-associated mycovirus]
MAHHMFMENLSVSNDQGSPFINNDELPEHQRARRAPNSSTGASGRGNPGAWVMYPDDKLADFISFLANTEIDDMCSASEVGIAPELIKVLRSTGVRTSPLDAFADPNYCVCDNELRFIDHREAALNLKKWVGSAIVQKKQYAMGVHPMTSPVPNEDPMLLSFAPQSLKTIAVLGGARAVTTDIAAHACQLLLNQQAEGRSERDQVILNAVLLHTMESRASIRPMKIQSRMGSNHAVVDPMNAISVKHSVTEDGYLREYSDFCEANRSTISTMMAKCMKAGIAHHGLDGLRTEEASASSKLASKRAGDVGQSKAMAAGDISRVDAMVVASQVSWWHPGVTMWIAAYKMSVAMLSSAKALTLSDKEVQCLVEYTFSRTTYRKLVASNALMDSTRDIAASEVTQAASTPIRWERQVHPLVLVLDDAEYSITRKTASVELTSVYNKVHAYMALGLGAMYGDIAKTGMQQPNSIGTGLLARSGRSQRASPVFARVQLTESAVTVTACPTSDSDAVLMTINKGVEKAGLHNIVLGNEVVKVIKKPEYGMTLTYLIPSTISGKGADKSYVYLAGMHFREDSLSYSLPTLEFLSQFTTLYEPMSPVKRQKMFRLLVDPTTTRVHHRHMSLLTVMATCGHAWAPCMDKVLQWPDITNTFMSSLLLAMAALPPELYVLMVEWNGWAKCDSMAEYILEAKNLTTKMKALDNQVTLGDFELDLAPLFEWEVLNHRAVLKGIYDKELIERRDEKQSIKLTAEELEAEIDSVFQDVSAVLDSRTEEGGKSPLYATWSDWYVDRVQTTPAGSAFTVNKDMMEARNMLKANGVQNLTKTQVMAQMRDNLPLSAVIGCEPMILAQMSWKLEWSKLRALFAASMEHWMPSAFSLGQIEEYLPSDCPIGKAADAHNVCRRVMEMSTQGVVACIDAKNFNILHTHKIMSAILTSASKMLGNRLSEEQHECLRWLAKAELNQKVLVKTGEVTEQMLEKGRQEGWINRLTKGDGTVVEAADVTVGMFSGTRFTMLYNTVLNRAYYKVAEKRAQIKTLSLHSGDDVYAVFANYIDVYKMKREMAKIGYTLQLGKCFLQGVREFLRISHKNANTSQYLARSAATAIHGRIEADEPSDFVAFVGSIMRRGAEMVVRHAARAVLLDVMKIQIAGACARWAVTAMAWDSFLMLPKIMGGCAAKARLTEQWNGFSIERTASARGSIVDYLAEQPGTRTAARRLVDKLQITKYHRRVAQAVAAAIAPKGVLKNYGMIVRWMNKDDMAHMSGVAGSLGRIRQSREYILSKAAGLFNTLAINDNF